MTPPHFYNEIMIVLLLKFGKLLENVSVCAPRTLMWRICLRDIGIGHVGVTKAC